MEINLVSVNMPSNCGDKPGKCKHAFETVEINLVSVNMLSNYRDKPGKC